MGSGNFDNISPAKRMSTGDDQASRARTGVADAKWFDRWIRRWQLSRQVILVRHENSKSESNCDESIVQIRVLTEHVQLMRSQHIDQPSGAESEGDAGQMNDR